jgi:O-antigen/teichoic acid export membrane protein
MPGLTFEAVSVINLACLFRAIGRTDLQVRHMTEGAVLRVALVLAAVPFGVEAVALSLTVWALFFVPRGWVLARRCAPVDMRRCVAAIALPVVMSAVFAGLHFLVVAQYPVGLFTEIALAAAGALAAIAAAALAGLRTLRSDIAILST